MGRDKRRSAWVLMLASLLTWVSIGCSPQSLSMFLMPFSDNRIDPEYKLFAAGKELKLVILSNFKQPEFDADIFPAEHELHDRVAEYLRKRCVENKHRVKIVPQVEVRNFQQKELLLVGEALALEAGKNFQADFVLDLEIRSFTLYQRKTFPKMFRGTTDIMVNLYKTDEKDNAHKVFFKELRCEYPGSGPIDAGNSDAVSFRGRFLTRVARDLSKLLIEFAPEERMLMD